MQPNPGAEGPAGDPTCGNGLDDDCDGTTDTGDPDCTGVELDWILVPGGTFDMGSDTGYPDEQPVHAVTIPDLEMTKTEITVEQYRVCVDDGACTALDTGSYCNWDEAGREDYPANCVDWYQAVDFCEWIGTRLPSEAEWEYAARSGGQNIEYPWGNQSPTCQYAVMDDGQNGCGLGGTWPVCSKTDGNTAQGLCDMSGNVWEWAQDWYHDSYTGAPTDGSAWESPAGDVRVVRGGSWSYNIIEYLRAASRLWLDPTFRYHDVGFRCGRTPR
jgi:formylglycine-generating enzyme required for sulfatase activity